MNLSTVREMFKKPNLIADMPTNILPSFSKGIIDRRKALLNLITENNGITRPDLIAICLKENIGKVETIRRDIRILCQDNIIRVLPQRIGVRGVRGTRGVAQELVAI